MLAVAGTPPATFPAGRALEGADHRMPTSRRSGLCSRSGRRRRCRSFLRSRLGCRGDGVVDEDGGDGDGGGEGFGVEDPGTGRGAIDEQRQLLAELLGVGGAGFAGGLGEPGGDGFLVVACVVGCGVLRVRNLDGRRDEGAQGRDALCPGRGARDGSEELVRGGRSVRSNTAGMTPGSTRRRYSATSSSLPVKCS